jgi:cytoskeletal protein CcmA (bactofilin family)
LLVTPVISLGGGRYEVVREVGVQGGVTSQTEELIAAGDGQEQGRGDRPGGPPSTARRAPVKSSASPVDTPTRIPVEVSTMFQREGGQGPAQAGGQAMTSAFLGKDTTVNGTVVFGGTARVEGQIEGQITAQDMLTIGETAVVQATVAGTVIVVQGTVTGDITAKMRLELRSPSKVKGNISAPTLVIEEGATFEGQCTMGGAAPAKVAPAPELRPQPVLSAVNS